MEERLKILDDIDLDEEYLSLFDVYLQPDELEKMSREEKIADIISYYGDYEDNN